MQDVINFILAKKQNQAHSKAELKNFINGYLADNIPNYQVSAWLMAVCLQGMTLEETINLTEVMAASGNILDLSNLPYTVDKHSTGGVGDKTSLVLAPLLATCGATVAKMSGRGLGHTGGTIDKLESIPNFKTTLSDEEFIKQARAINIVISAQSKNLAPADGKLYALRDITATIDSLPLIASSVMSKKLASGAKSIVLDVKVGKGAFMKNLMDAKELAQLMVKIGKKKERNVRAVLSNMDDPLGFAVGNTLEVQEAISCLKGENISDLRELCLTLAEQLLEMASLTRSREDIAKLLDNGKAYETFERWISAQGGNVEALDKLELAPNEYIITAPKQGYLTNLNALEIGEAVKALGGGRYRKDQKIDLGVGVVLHAKSGDFVFKGMALMTMYHRNNNFEKAKELLEQSFSLNENPAGLSPLIFEIMA